MIDNIFRILVYKFSIVKWFMLNLYGKENPKRSNFVQNFHRIDLNDQKFEA